MRAAFRSLLSLLCRCLYEIGSTPAHKLELLTHGFSERDVSEHLRHIDAETALCFSDADKVMIRGEIEVRFGFGSLARFTQDLRLRFLLRPMGYDVDLNVLRERGREWLLCLRREWPAGVIMMVVTLWVLDHTVNKYGLWRRMSAGWWYGNYERLR